MKQSQVLIAVFDDWDAFRSLLADLGTETTARSGALLHARKDEPPLMASQLVHDMTALEFAACSEQVRCTTGGLAEELARRSAAGAHSLAAALQGWVGNEQARELQWHIEHGRLVLWLQPGKPEDFDGICARLVLASPHVVGVCDVDLKT